MGTRTPEHGSSPRLTGLVFDCGPCPYLPDRRFEAFHPLPNPPPNVSFRDLLDNRFRRSGAWVYSPACSQCHECQPIRVDVPAFAPRKDQRRCQRRNADLTVTFTPRGMSPERRALFERYQADIHNDPVLPGSRPEDFLVEDGGIPGGELHARDGDGRLLAVSIIDLAEDAVSSVYCYYEPTEPRRSLGTFMVLAEIDWCRRQGRRWLYLGFLVRDCGKMAYKARFRPHEVQQYGRWVRAD